VTELEAAIQRAPAAMAGAVLVAEEAGVGKTGLLDEIPFGPTAPPSKFATTAAAERTPPAEPGSWSSPTASDNLDGRLPISSPTGAGTTISAESSCAS
jgi:hypothetical protein